jgi:hypothetical protein
VCVSPLAMPRHCVSGKKNKLLEFGKRDSPVLAVIPTRPPSHLWLADARGVGTFRERERESDIEQQVARSTRESPAPSAFPLAFPKPTKPRSSGLLRASR